MGVPFAQATARFVGAEHSLVETQFEQELQRRAHLAPLCDTEHSLHFVTVEFGFERVHVLLRDQPIEQFA